MNEPVIRQLVFGGKIISPPLSGQSTIFSLRSLFSYVDPSLDQFNKPCEPTEETELVMHELIKSSNLRQVFLSINQDLRKICLTQHQIIEFALNQLEQFRRDGYGTFALFRDDTMFHLVNIGFTQGGAGLLYDYFDSRAITSLGDKQKRILVVA